jgi:uncharacterized membrane protein
VTGVTQVAIPGSPFLQEHAFVLNGQRMRDLGTLGGKFSVGYAINRWGWVAGRSQLADAERALDYRARGHAGRARGAGGRPCDDTGPGVQLL